jgi:hypothetical protein
MFCCVTAGLIAPGVSRGFCRDRCAIAGVAPSTNGAARQAVETHPYKKRILARDIVIWDEFHYEFGSVPLRSRIRACLITASFCFIGNKMGQS